MHVADARAIAARPSIDREGYELWDAPTGVADFADEAAIRRYYYAEAAELARWVTGARQAWVFDHLVRRREAGRPALGFGRQGDGSNPAAVGRVHNDYSEASGRRRLELVLTDPAELARVERFAIVNIWRSIRGPVLDTPLAVCDARSVSSGIWWRPRSATRSAQARSTWSAMPPGINGPTFPAWTVTRP